MQDFASALCVFVSTITYAQTCDGIKFDVFIIIMKLLVCMCACVHVYWEVSVSLSQTLAQLSISSLQATGRVLLKVHATELATGKNTSLLCWGRLRWSVDLPVVTNSLWKGHSHQ